MSEKCKQTNFMTFLIMKIAKSNKLFLTHRYEIKASDYLTLSRNAHDPQDDHQRACLQAAIEVPLCGALNFFVTHLTLSDSARDRTVVEISDWIKALNDETANDLATHPHAFSTFPVSPRVRNLDVLANVLVGDYNTLPDSSSIRFLLGELEIAGKQDTFFDAWTEKYPSANGNSTLLEKG